MASGDHVSAVRSLLEWNRLVMAIRGAGPWARVGNFGRIDVRYRGAEQLLPDGDELGSTWRNTYFFDSLKRITHQLQQVT